MALTSRIALRGADAVEVEDVFSSALGVIFPDDVTNQHGDAEHGLVYTSPHLPAPLLLDLADPVDEVDRRLFSHYLWNASLLLALLVERDSLPVAEADARPRDGLAAGVSFDVRGKALLELGAGTALPSIMAGLLGARRILVTDYPSPAVITTLEANVVRNVDASLAPPASLPTASSSLLVRGHRWGQLDEEGALFPADGHAFDRVLVADCLWMPWQHANLHRSIDHFLAASAEARCWLVAGFHTGRHNVRGFFDPEALLRANLLLDCIWERDCDGKEREWAWERPDEDVSVRKRWLLVAVLKRPLAPSETAPSPP